MKIQVFQSYYEADQKSHLDPLFVKWDTSASQFNATWCEYALFSQLFQRGIHRNFNYLGLVSWKFYQKTGLTGSQVYKWIDENPGRDVYYINSHPFGELYQNVWWQLDHWHPGVLSVGTYLMQRMGIDLDLKKWVQPRHEISFSNFWIGNEVFWERYFEFARVAYEYLSRPMPVEIRTVLDKPQASGLSLRPYVMECLFSTLLGLARMNQLAPIHSLRFQDPFEPEYPAASLIERLKTHLHEHPEEVPKAYPRVHSFLKQMESELSEQP